MQIYEKACKSCKKSYKGETGRTQKKEHQTECKKETRGHFIRIRKDPAKQELSHHRSVQEDEPHYELEEGQDQYSRKQ